MLNPYIDHTILHPTTTLAQVAKLCQEAVEYKFAAVCVPPLYVSKAKEYTLNSSVQVATVIGFPYGYSAIEAKIAEILLAIVDGAHELDMVINLAALKSNDWQYLANEITHVMSIITQKQKVLKVIIETGLLTTPEIIQCCDVYGAAGVQYIKTSTGTAAVGATIEAVQLIRKHTANTVHIKASGGIKTAAFAHELIQAGASRIGTSAGVSLMQSAE